MRRSLWFAIAAPLLLSACGSQDATVAGTDADDAPATSPTGDPTEYTGTGTVLENAEHGPQLCLGAIALSYPPQCGGPDIAGWSWEGLEGAESASGATWGVYIVTGTFDGTTFTLTRPALPAMNTTPIPPDMPPPADFTTPCEPPPGGWVTIDSAKTTEAALTAAFEHAQGQADYAGGWIDQSPFDVTPENESARLNHPAYLVLNVRFTADLERHETDLREIWGGALCVGSAKHSERDMAAIQKDLQSDTNVLGSRTDVTSDVLIVDAIVDNGLQERLDEKYGNDVTRVYAALRPISS